MQFRCRKTGKAAKSDLLSQSATERNVDRGNFLRRVVAYVRTAWGHWNRTGGRDHLFVMAVRLLGKPPPSKALITSLNGMTNAS